MKCCIGRAVVLPTHPAGDLVRLSANGSVFCCGQLLLQMPNTLSLGCQLLLSFS